MVNKDHNEPWTEQLLQSQSFQEIDMNPLEWSLWSPSENPQIPLYVKGSMSPSSPYSPQNLQPTIMSGLYPRMFDD